MRKKVFVRKDGRKNILIFSLVLLVAVIVIAVISLLPNRAPTLGNTRRNGVGRSFLFPLVFTSSNGTLHVLSDGYRVTEIDDSVSAVQHDIEKELVFYLREGSLYEYHISKNQRRKLVPDVVTYQVFPDRSAIVCVEENSTVKLFQYSKDSCLILSDSGPKRESVSRLTVMGQEGVLFLDRYRQEGSQPSAALMLANARGETVQIAEKINVGKSFYFGEKDQSVAYYIGEDLYLANAKGTVLRVFPNGQVVQAQLQPQAVISSTPVSRYTENIPLTYFLTNVSVEGKENSLVYFNGKKELMLASGVQKLIYYSADRNTVWYTLTSEEEVGSVNIYQSVQGRAPQFLLRCPDTAKFLLDGDLTYLYFQQEDGSLYRFSVLGRNSKPVLLSNDTGSLYVYANKPYIVFQDALQEYQYIVLDNNSIERFENNEIRLYGRFQNKYLLCRANQAGLLTLDYVEDDAYTRICGDVQQPVLFDKNFEYILFVSGEILYGWRNGTVTEIGEYTGLTAVPMIT